MALHVAARCCLLPMVTPLLLDGADPRAMDDQGRTPLRVAQELNNTMVVRHLLLHDELLCALARRLGREPLQPDIVAMIQSPGMHAFREEVRVRVAASSEKVVDAARLGDLDTVRSMLESGEISIDAVSAVRGETAFSAALSVGHIHVCEYLLAKGAHVFARCVVDGVSELAITRAAIEGDVSFVRRIAARGAMRSVANTFGQTCALAEAVKLGSIEMVDTLLQLGAGACGASRHRGLRLPWPAQHAIHCGSTNPDDDTPWWLLEFACWLQDTRLIKQLFAIFDALRSRDMMSRYGARALFLAICRDDQEITVDLLDRGASINQPVNFGLTAMVAAVAINSPKMLHFLMKRGGDPNVIHTSTKYGTGHPQGLLATAIYANAMDCAYELLSMENRPQQLDEALAVATKVSEIEYVGAHLEKALPSTIEALHSACATNCPLVLDVLLTQCCAEIFHISDVKDCFKEACRSHTPDLVAVFLAHGMGVSCDEDTGHE